MLITKQCFSPSKKDQFEDWVQPIREFFRFRHIASDKVEQSVLLVTDIILLQFLGRGIIDYKVVLMFLLLGAYRKIEGR